MVGRGVGGRGVSGDGGREKESSESDGGVERSWECGGLMSSDGEVGGGDRGGDDMFTSS